jgi:SAM-dependent methyltransferase
MTTAARRIAENRAAHDRITGATYAARHPEIYNDVEQARLVDAVARAVGCIATTTVPAERVMLELGAGPGNLTEKLLAHPGTVLATDLSTGMLQALQLRLGNSGRLRTQPLNGADLREFATASVDMVAAYSVLHHVPDYLALVAECGRVVRPGGVVYFEHEKAPGYWSPTPALQRFLETAVVWPEKSWTRFIDPRRYWARVRPWLIWQRWGDPRWMPEGDLHIWPDDHIEWTDVEQRLRAQGCEPMIVEDHLAYEPRFDRARWESARHEAADTRMFVARKVA